MDRQAWVSVLDLEIGETLKTLEGTTVVESLVRRSSPEAVYNIEVEGDHCYRVGESGVLVHNQSVPSTPCYIVNVATYQSQSGDVRSVIQAVWDLRRGNLVMDGDVERARGNIAGGKVALRSEIIVEPSGQPISARPLTDAEQAVIRYVEEHFDTPSCKAKITHMF